MRKITDYFSRKIDTDIPDSHKIDTDIPDVSKIDTIDYKLHIRIIPTFIETHSLYDHLMSEMGFDITKQRRQKKIYGCIKHYCITYRGQSIQTPVIHWDAIPVIRNMAEHISLHYTHMPIHTVTVHFYPTGNIGIKPHRDKEMLSNSIIASVSLGATRVMRFERNKGAHVHDFALTDGSLCLIMPPTNDVWLHSIPLDASCKKSRMSIIFRNYPETEC